MSEAKGLVRPFPGTLGATRWLRGRFGWMYHGRSPVYVFHHVPRCGGTSVRKALKRWFSVYGDYRKGWTMEYPDRVNTRFMGAHECLCGHWENEGYHLHQRYPEVLEKGRFKVYTFLRDPLEVRLSLYYYERSNRGGPTVALEEYLDQSENYFAQVLPCTEANYRDVLDRYFFIGIAEDLQRSMDLLADVMGKPRVELTRINASARDSQVEGISPDVAARFRERNALDYRIYEEALRRFGEHNRDDSRVSRSGG